jgi:flagellar biosynthesis protein FlhA
MAINLVAGLFIGMIQDGLSLDNALRTYTILTVGDGLAAQIPALLTSTAAGVIVSRSAGDLDLPSTVSRELLGKPGVLVGAAGLLALVGLMPGLPHLPF